MATLGTLKSARSMEVGRLIGVHYKLVRNGSNHDVIDMTLKSKMLLKSEHI